MGPSRGSRCFYSGASVVSAGIDSMTLIYAGVAPPKSGVEIAEDLRLRSKLLLYILGRRESPIILPMIAVSELLVPLSPTQRGALLQELTRRFLCPVFDLRAAALAAELFAEHLQLPNRHYPDRTVLKADLMIVASAKAAGATEFFSNDPHCRALAKLAGLKDRELPTGDTLENRWYLEEARRGEV